MTGVIVQRAGRFKGREKIGTRTLAPAAPSPVIPSEARNLAGRWVHSSGRQIPRAPPCARQRGRAAALGMTVPAGMGTYVVLAVSFRAERGIFRPMGSFVRPEDSSRATVCVIARPRRRARNDSTVLMGNTLRCRHLAPSCRLCHLSFRAKRGICRPMGSCVRPDDSSRATLCAIARLRRRARNDSTAGMGNMLCRHHLAPSRRFVNCHSERSEESAADGFMRPAGRFLARHLVRGNEAAQARSE